MTAHYPTSAELAAFRRDMIPATPQGRRLARHAFAAPWRGATLAECASGIGQSGHEMAHGNPQMIARREAARLRHEAYMRMCDTAIRSGAAMQSLTEDEWAFVPEPDRDKPMP